MHRALAGKTVTSFESFYPALTRIADDHPIVGRSVESVSARGKHLLITLSGDLTLRTHMRMSGSWHLYRPGVRWQRPARDMRVLLSTEDVVAVGFNIPVAELLTGRDLARHRELRALGPDLLDSAFDRAEAIRRLRAQGRQTVADALLDQRVMAGIGNVFKSETLFLAGIHPFTRVSEVPDEALARLVDIARDALKANTLSRSQSLNASTARTTTRSMDPNRKLWVYGRGGKRCLKCGTVIEARKTGLDARLTYWCPGCQKKRGD